MPGKWLGRMIDLTSQVNKALAEFVDGVEKDVLKIEEEVGKEAVKKLKSTSPKNSNGKGKHYADSWYIDNRSKKMYAHITVANRQYQLTHLLENGHDIIRDGKKVGRYEPKKKHIKPVEEWVKDEVVKRLENEI